MTGEWKDIYLTNDNHLDMEMFTFLCITVVLNVFLSLNFLRDFHGYKIKVKNEKIYFTVT